MLDKNGIAKRIAKEVRDGWCVNCNYNFVITGPDFQLRVLAMPYAREYPRHYPDIIIFFLHQHIYMRFTQS